MPKPRKNNPSAAVIAEKITARITPSDDGCWIWPGATGTTGYGRAYIGRFDGKYKTADCHRIMWEANNGPIPDGMCVCHRCDKKRCVNPEHLFLGTQKDNLRDMTEKARRSQGPDHAEKIKAGWTPELRAMRAEQTRQRMRQQHLQRTKEAGVRADWKYCPACEEWRPRSAFPPNRARYDGLGQYCRGDRN